MVATVTSLVFTLPLRTPETLGRFLFTANGAERARSELIGVRNHSARMTAPSQGAQVAADLVLVSFLPCCTPSPSPSSTRTTGTSRPYSPMPATALLLSSLVSIPGRGRKRRHVHLLRRVAPQVVVASWSQEHHRSVIAVHHRSVSTSSRPSPVRSVAPSEPFISVQLISIQRTEIDRAGPRLKLRRAEPWLSQAAAQAKPEPSAANPVLPLVQRFSGFIPD